MQRNRLLLLAAACAVAALVVVALIVVGSDGDTTVARTTVRATTTTTRAKRAPRPSFLAGVPQHGDTLGKANAPATLTVFEDPQCPFCREWDVGTLPTVVERYVKTGRVKLVFRGIEVIGPNSLAGLRAIDAAGRQNRLWTMVDELYKRQGAENSGWITRAVVVAAARASGASGTAILAAANSAAVTKTLKDATGEATALAVRGTPTFVVERPPGLPQQLSLTALDPATFTAALDAALQ